MLILTRETRIDWARIVANLRKSGLSVQDIADAVGVGYSTIYGYASEDIASEPPYWCGSALLVLWSQRLGCRWTDAPTRRVTPSVSQVLRESA